MDRPLDALPGGTKLAGYVIGPVLGRGSFGVTYLATDDLFPDRKFAIKEFLPGGIAVRKPGEASVHPTGPDNVETFRHALASFRREALTLRELSHPNVVHVERYIEANGTAYMVMAFEEGGSLATALERGPFDEEEIRELLPPLLDGLEAIHAKNFVHRDLKPANIYLRADGSPVLLDFGAAREAIGERRQGSLSEIVTPGYAPLEQYDRHAAQGPYTDIYALGATLYRCMTGRSPPEAITRHNALRRGGEDPLVPVDRAAPGRFSPPLAEAVRRSLEIDEHKRPQTVAELRALLRGAQTQAKPAAAIASAAPARAAAPAARGQPPARTPVRRRGGGRRVALAAVLVAAIAGVAFGAYLFLAPGPVPSPAAERPAAAPSAPGRAFRDCPQCPEMVAVPAGNFLMGSATGAETANDDEYPQHRVSIAKPFAIGKYEVTHAEWEACVAAKACERADDNGFGRGRRPVINVSSAAAKRYAAWLSRTTGKTYRLPSESEWEYAARAKTATRYPWGDTLIRNRANCGSCGSQWDEKQTAPVGSFAANGFGLHDMQGNVWEIVEDCVNKHYRGAPADGRPWLGGDCSRRVMRGGSWNNYHDVIRSAQRESIGADDVSYDIGFRLVREID